MTSNDRYQDEDESPLHSKRAFGAGLYRKPIAFLPAKSGGLSSTHETSTSSATAVADMYLDLVLSPKDKESTASPLDVATTQVCEVCNLAIKESELPGVSSGPTIQHETTIAHQVCLTHSHPPSALDRSRMGLSVLQSQGWNPDSRKGLGAVQQGIQHPVKAKEKRDNLGIGIRVPKNLEAYKKEKPQKLDAGKVRKMAAEDKKRRERLQRQFYGNGELEKYLGSG